MDFACSILQQPTATFSSRAFAFVLYFECGMPGAPLHPWTAVVDSVICPRDYPRALYNLAFFQPSVYATP